MKLSMQGDLVAPRRASRGTRIQPAATTLSVAIQDCLNTTSNYSRNITDLNRIDCFATIVLNGLDAAVLYHWSFNKIPFLIRTLAFIVMLCLLSTGVCVCVFV